MDECSASRNNDNDICLKHCSNWVAKQPASRGNASNLPPVTLFHTAGVFIGNLLPVICPFRVHLFAVVCNCFMS